MEVPLDGAWTQKQLSADLRVREAVPGQTRYLRLLRRQLVTRVVRSTTRLRTSGDQPTPSALGERLHADPREQLLARSQSFARLAEAPFAKQPLAVDEVRTREFGAVPTSNQLVDRFLVQRPGVIGREQRLRARLDAARQMAVGRPSGRQKTVKSSLGEVPVSSREAASTSS